MSAVEEWNVQFRGACQKLQSISSQVDERIRAIRGGEDRSKYALMHSKNLQGIRNLDAEVSRLSRSLDILSRGQLQPKDVQDYSQRLDKFQQQLRNVEQRAKLSEAEIVSESRFIFFLVLCELLLGYFYLYSLFSGL